MHRKSPGHWKNLDNLLDAARQCDTLSDFRSRFPAANNYAKSVGIIDWLCLRAPLIRKTPFGHWDSYSNVIEALEGHTPSTLKELREEFPLVYDAAYRNGHLRRLEEDLNLVRNQQNRTEQVLYVYENFPYAYVGITRDPHKRHKQHRLQYKTSCGKSFTEQPKYFERNGIPHRISSNEKALRLERRIIYRYAKSGWQVTNIQNNPQYNGTRHEWEN